MERGMTNKTIVWLVMNHVNWIGSFARSVWSSKEQAEQECDRLNEIEAREGESCFGIEPWELDSSNGYCLEADGS